MPAAAAPYAVALAGLTLTMAAALVLAVWRFANSVEARRRWALATAVITGGWLALTATLAVRGTLSDFNGRPPVFVRLLAFSLLMTVAVALSPFGARILRAEPLRNVVGFQLFRVAVELILFGLCLGQLIPVQMTFEGLNFDILAGLSAGLIAWRLARTSVRPRWILAWNLVSLGLLATIVVIANLSAPTPFRVFRDGPSSSLLATFPFVWLPTFLVPSALFGHVLVFRWLAGQKTAAATHPA